MTIFVWIPGILGSILKQVDDGSQIWPPDIDANGFLFPRTFDQLTDDLEPTGIISSVLCFQFYSNLDEMFAAAGIFEHNARAPATKSRLSYPYDWRRSIFSQADRLATQLDALGATTDEFVFLAHSMGNLVCRLLIEADQYKGRPFRAKVTRYISVNGPHIGAPVMLARALGLQWTEGVSHADQTRILAQTPFSAGYDLFPRPGYDCLINVTVPLDPYDPANAPWLRFGAENVAEAKAFWGTAGFGSAAKDVTYILVRSYLDADGTGASTVAAVKSDGHAWGIEFGPGDGAVPKVSADSFGREDVVLPGEHTGVFGTDLFRTAVFERYIAPIHAAELLSTVVAQPSLKLQPLAREVAAGERVTFALVHDHSGQPFPVTGTISWHRLTGKGDLANAPAEHQTAVAFEAVMAPTQSSAAPTRAGLYRVVVQPSEPIPYPIAATSVLVSGHPKASPAPPPPPATKSNS